LSRERKKRRGKREGEKRKNPGHAPRKGGRRGYKHQRGAIRRGARATGGDETAKVTSQKSEKGGGRSLLKRGVVEKRDTEREGITTYGNREQGTN